MARKTLIHKHTNLVVTNNNIISPKLPSSGVLEKGEIAVNYKDGYETLSIENDLGEVVPFASLEQMMSYVDNSLPDLELSSNYSTSDLENENLQLAGGDSYEEAFSKLEKAILDDEEIVATSLVELNDRINDSINQIPETVLSEQYATSTDSNEDLFLEAGDTYEEAFSKLEKSINDNEQITSAALSDLDSRIPTKISDLDNDSLASLDSILLPNFNNLTPINTIEFDVSATTYYKLFERINTGVSNLKDVNEIIKFRITVTGTNIYSESDVIVIMPLALIYPTILGYNRTLNNAAATTGLMYLRCCYPKALNNNYPWMTELRVYNNTARHIKIEVFESPENITWVTSKTSTTYNSTYLSSQEVLFYTRRGFISSGVSWMAGDIQGTATSAAYINGYLDIWVNGTLPLTGEALTTNSLIYMSGDKLYKATNKTMPIEPFVGIIKTGTSYNAGVTPSYAYLQLKNSWTALTGDSALVIPTLTRGDQVYLRCTMNNGNIYSDGTLSTTMDAGYTWVHIGTAQSATAINLDTCGKFFITLASDGKITHINGKAIQGGSGGGGDENVIEIVKVNGTALTPDANKAVNIDLSSYDKTPLIIEIDSTDTTVPSGTYTNIGNALANDKEVYVKMNGDGYSVYYLKLFGDFSEGRSECYDFYSGGARVSVWNDNTLSIEFDMYAASEHYHGDIDNDGTLNNSTPISIANGDRIVITDASSNEKIQKTSITFDGSTTTTALTPKGTWETFLKTAPVTSVNGQQGAVSLALGQTNVIETVKVNNTALTPDANKAVNVTVPTISYTLDASNSVGQLSLNGTTYTLISGTSPMGSSEAYTAPSWGAFNNIKPWAFDDVRVAGEQWSDTELIGGSHYLKFEAPFYLSSGSNGPGITLATNDLNSGRTVINQILSGYDTTGNDAWSHAGDTALATVGLIKTKVDAKYTKPSTGIPKTDLASAVLTSLGKADSAIQSHQSIKSINTNNTTAQTVNSSEAVAGSGTINLHKVAKTGTYSDLIGTPTIPAAVTESTVSGWGFTKNTGTITGITMNGSSKGTSGVVNLGTVLTSHQTLKTINNESIVGSGNLTIPTLPTVTASDNGKILQVVNGSWALVTPTAIYSGTSTPNNSTGNDGDLYLQTS